MKKKGRIIVSIIIFFILFSFRNYIYVFIYNLFHFERLDKKYEKYQNINTDKDLFLKKSLLGGKYEIEHAFHRRWRPLQIADAPNNQVAFIDTDGDDATFYKYNSEGNFMGKINLSPYYKYHNGYIIDTIRDNQTYLTWYFDNDTIAKPITSESEKLFSQEIKSSEKKAKIPKINYVHFHKTRKRTKTVTSQGDPNFPDFFPERHRLYYWEGRLFFDVIIDKDTLKLSDDFLLSKPENVKDEYQFKIKEKSIGKLKSFHNYDFGFMEDEVVTHKNCYTIQPFFQNFFLMRKYNERDPNAGHIFIIKRKK